MQSAEHAIAINTKFWHLLLASPWHSSRGILKGEFEQRLEGSSNPSSGSQMLESWIRLLKQTHKVCHCSLSGSVHGQHEYVFYPRSGRYVSLSLHHRLADWGKQQLCLCLQDLLFIQRIRHSSSGLRHHSFTHQHPRSVLERRRQVLQDAYCVQIRPIVQDVAEKVNIGEGGLRQE